MPGEPGIGEADMLAIVVLDVRDQQDLGMVGQQVFLDDVDFEFAEAAAEPDLLLARQMLIGKANDNVVVEGTLDRGERVVIDRLRQVERDFGAAGGVGFADRYWHRARPTWKDRAIIAFDGPDSEDLLHTIRLVKALGVKVSVLPRLLEVVGSASTYDDIDGLPLLGVKRYGLSRSSDLLKRAVDLVGASIVLLFLSPLFAAIALAIKLDSPGPVFFRQRRIGRCSESFGMFKFRSMVENAEEVKDELRAQNEAAGGLFKIEDDPRITHVGNLLRKTSIDELPQLFNVIKGDMSLVGPRPLVPDEDRKIEGWQRRRAGFRPGMTGMWQIFGASRIPMHEMVKIDYLYGANWSVWRDLKILARTVPVVIGRRGL